MKISIILRRKEIVNDIMTHCNVIGRSLRKNPETEETAGEIMTPDDIITKPIVARSLTEAFGQVKVICQQYLMFGRFSDDNRLEKIDESNRYSETVKSTPVTTACKYRLLTAIPYKISIMADSDVKVMDDEGTILARGTEILFNYTPVRDNEYLTLQSPQIANVTIDYIWGDFGKYELLLNMPAFFNPAVTETIKSCAHKMMVDYVMSQLLKDQYNEKAVEYAGEYAADMENLRKSLISRLAYGRPYASDWS